MILPKTQVAQALISCRGVMYGYSLCVLVDMELFYFKKVSTQRLGGESIE